MARVVDSVSAIDFTQLKGTIVVDLVGGDQVFVSTQGRHKQRRARRILATPLVRYEVAIVIDHPACTNNDLAAPNSK
jgi:hypothetical protein